MVLNRLLCADVPYTLTHVLHIASSKEEKFIDLNFDVHSCCTALMLSVSFLWHGVKHSAYESVATVWPRCILHKLLHSVFCAEVKTDAGMIIQ